MGEMIQKNEYDELKEKYVAVKEMYENAIEARDRLISQNAERKAKYDELRDLYITLQQEKNLFQESYNDLSSRLIEAQKDRDLFKDMYNGSIAVRDKMTQEYAKVVEDFNKLTEESRALKEELDKLRARPHPKDTYILEQKNGWADSEEAKKFFESLQQEPIKLSPVLSEVPNMVINTKNLYLTFDNHTNNFKEDDE